MKANVSGWFKQSLRHSNARRFGRAGGTYSKGDKIQFTDFGTDRKVGTQVYKNLGNNKILVYHPASFDEKGNKTPFKRISKADLKELIKLDIDEDEVKKFGKIMNINNDKYYLIWKVAGSQDWEIKKVGSKKAVEAERKLLEKDLIEINDEESEIGIIDGLQLKEELLENKIKISPWSQIQLK